LEIEPPLAASFHLIFSFLFWLNSSGIIFGGIVFLICLLVGSALISGSEVAYFSLSPQDLDKLKSDSSKSSKKILQLRDMPRTLLATILISNNFINIAIVILSEFLIWRSFGEEIFLRWATSLKATWSIQWDVDLMTRGLNLLVTTVGVTFLLVLFGEVAPKFYAKINNLAFAKFMSGPLRFLKQLFYPLSILLVGSVARIERSLANSTSSDRTKKLDEIDQAIDITMSGEVEAQDEVEILKNIIKFNEVTAKQIMQSRVDVVTVGVDESYSQLLHTIRESGFSRIPIYEYDFDSVIGILYAKDLIGKLNEGQNYTWRNLVRTDVHYVPENKKINELLKEFQQKRMHMAIVVDEYGGSSGIVTLEDVMEEVIGEIRDEFDQVDEIEFTQIDDKTYIFEGKTLLNDVCRVMNIDSRTFDLFKGDSDSIAGLMLEICSHIPKSNEELILKGYRLTATSVSKRRVEKVKITRL
jgi:gliding motility-associated protein GldE